MTSVPPAATVARLRMSDRPKSALASTRGNRVNKGKAANRVASILNGNHTWPRAHAVTAQAVGDSASNDLSH
jgi:hypothetical protein